MDETCVGEFTWHRKAKTDVNQQCQPGGILKCAEVGSSKFIGSVSVPGLIGNCPENCPVQFFHTNFQPVFLYGLLCGR